MRYNIHYPLVSSWLVSAFPMALKTTSFTSVLRLPAWILSLVHCLHCLASPSAFPFSCTVCTTAACGIHFFLQI
ncbi:hypothetical protein B0H10DRAFT_2095485, partial [Mycena sp. CBHHK59/15]